MRRCLLRLSFWRLRLPCSCLRRELRLLRLLRCERAYEASLLLLLSEYATLFTRGQYVVELSMRCDKLQDLKGHQISLTRY